MARAPIDEPIVGYFTEKDFGKEFDYSLNDELILAPPAHGGKNVVFPHKVFVGPLNEWRYARVLGNVVHIITDELPNGNWCVQKWEIKNHRRLSC